MLSMMCSSFISMHSRSAHSSRHWWGRRRGECTSYRTTFDSSTKHQCAVWMTSITTSSREKRATAFFEKHKTRDTDYNRVSSNVRLEVSDSAQGGSASGWSGSMLLWFMYMFCIVRSWEKDMSVCVLICALVLQNITEVSQILPIEASRGQWFIIRLSVIKKMRAPKNYSWKQEWVDRGLLSVWKRRWVNWTKIGKSDSAQGGSASGWSGSMALWWLLMHKLEVSDSGSFHRPGKSAGESPREFESRHLRILEFTPSGGVNWRMWDVDDSNSLLFHKNTFGIISKFPR